MAAEKDLDIQFPDTTLTRVDDSDIDFQISPKLEEDIDFFNSTGIMSGTGDSTPYVHVKKEPDDFDWNLNIHQTNFTNSMNTIFPHGHENVNPSDLGMSNSQLGLSYDTNNVSSSYMNGGSRVDDDELEGLDLNDTSKNGNHFHQAAQPQSMQSFFPEQIQTNQDFFPSNTPDGNPIQSPFTGNFNWQNYMPPSSHTSPFVRPSNRASFVPTQKHGSSYPYPMDRKTSGPLSPRTPGLSGLTIGSTPESDAFPAQPIRANGLSHRHQKSLSGQWGDSTPGSLSYVDSPLVSPHQHSMNQNQISEMLKSGKHASLPAKVENDGHVGPAYQTQEAKRRKRRESHNMVERRRRDNINERIQELSHLVPQHRLEDEKVRKHLANNSPLSPALAATSMSPPQATSLLAGGGRRATGAGNITMGIPLEEKDKGPNKGDILNGSVSWTRDLMWALQLKLQQEEQLQQLIAQLGGTWPFQRTEDENRMRTELTEALEKNNINGYSRGDGSGLRVPRHTNIAGEALTGSGQDSGNVSAGGHQFSPHLSPNGSGHMFWPSSSAGHRGSAGLKEEDEYDMQLS
jgi:hypothetical protein